jgi:hypothetical protein
MTIKASYDLICEMSPNLSPREAVLSARKLANASREIFAKIDAEKEALKIREEEKRREALAGFPESFLAA